ncbi:MAG TPA: hypothetical protein VFC56_16920 [Stellaceae bacterium]|nr:hypothetical protein [Stellaceae bacterium]
MLRKLAVATTLAVTAIGAAAPAMADRYCGPGFHYRYHECRPNAYYYPPGGVVGSAVGTAGYVAGSAVNTAGAVAGTAVNTAGAIAGGVIGAVTGR